MLKVRRARADEFDQVLDFYTNMIDGMRGTEFDVCWEHDVHPTRAFLRASTEAGAKALRLDTFTTNGRAQGLYESCGFANCGVYEDFYPHLGRGGVLYEFAL